MRPTRRSSDFPWIVSSGVMRRQIFLAVVRKLLFDHVDGAAKFTVGVLVGCFGAWVARVGGWLGG